MARDAAYRRAEKKIDAARRSGATKLYLIRLGEESTLTELPESLGRLTQLKTLKLAGNRLTALPEWLATAISFVLDDRKTREDHGLVSVARLGQLWDDPARQELAALRGDVASQTAASRELVSKVEASYDSLMRTLLDEAKDGPRLFSLAPVDPGFFDRPGWMEARFRLTLWCEHARLPLPALNGKGDRRGVYELVIPRGWFVKSAPFLRVLAGTLGLVMPVAASAVKLALDDAAYTAIGEQLDLAQKGLDLALNADDVGRLSRRDAPDLEHGEMLEARGAVLRQLHAWLKEQDPTFGGLVRVQNKRQEFLWVHPQFETEY